VTSHGPAAALVWCPFPDTETARAAAATLLSERLIACANMFAGIESHFVWNGEPAHSTETGMLCKTTSECLPMVIKRLGELHPYDTPAIIGWCCDTAHPASMAWMTAQCSGAEASAAD
jgi:periplasmic divalent cation tolerance protein